jgi:hypothetical protein
MKHNQNGASHAPSELHPAPKSLQGLTLGILFVGVHSLALGTYIFLFTESFYYFFFGTRVVNFFFVQQAGLFLFCLGMFYLVPLADLERNHRLIDIIIITKIMAVLFLLCNSRLVPRPEIIFLAAVGDGVMAILLIIFSRAAGLLLKKSESSSV